MRNITKQQFDGMNPDQMRAFLKQAYSAAAKNLPEGPEKTLTLKIGRLCIRAEDLKQKYDASQDDDERENIIKDMEDNVSQAISLMTKILVLRQAEKIHEEVVEIEESGEFEDPWADKVVPSISKVVPSISKNIEVSGEYDPWKVEE
jgi:hypothetical protein